MDDTSCNTLLHSAERLVVLAGAIALLLFSTRLIKGADGDKLVLWAGLAVGLLGLAGSVATAILILG